MSLRSEINDGYIDGNGLVAPARVPAGAGRASDNGVMFTSEYYILLGELGELLPCDDRIDYYHLISQCVGADGELHRAPKDSSPDETDDYHGAYAAHIALGLAPDFRLPVRLWRQPQLIALAAIASQNILYRILAMPFIVYAALVLATSCIGVPSSDTDARRLSWLLGKGTKSSLLCRLAFKLWKARLLKTYPEGMKTVAQMYYQGGHPFGRHMVKY